MDNQENRNSDLAAAGELAAEGLAGRHIEPGREFPDELLHELLRGSAEGQLPDTTGEGDPDGSPTQPTLTDLVRSKGLDPDQVMQAPIGLPEELGTATLQELKDEAVAYRKGKQQQDTLSQSRTEFANQKLKFMQELQQAVAALPQEVLQNPEKLAPVAQFLQAQQAQQDRLLLEVIPGWHDEAVKAQDNERISAYLNAEYGAPTEAWQQPAPAWIRKLVYDHWQITERMKAIGTRRKAEKASKGTPQAPKPAERSRRANGQFVAKTESQIDSILDVLTQQRGG